MHRCSILAVPLLFLAHVASAEDAATPPPDAAAAPATEVPPAQPMPEAAPPPPPPAAAAAPAQPPPPPKKPRPIYTWVSVGTTFAYGQTYGSANAGVGYLMQHGLAPNVELAYAFGNSPTLWTLRPGVTWYAPLPFHPYVGAYYTHWFVDGASDQNGVGARGGFSLGRVLSLAVTYDRALNCSRDCDIWTPQISAGLAL